MSKLHGIWGKPYIDLSEHVDRSELDDVHDEITSGLVHAECTYTGGSLKWMGICAPWSEADPYRDVNWVIEELSDREFAAFCALGEPPYDPSIAPRQFGDETEQPLSYAQMRWLEIRHGVYFPWRTCFHFLENRKWEDKHSGQDKAFHPEALRLFPRTVTLLRRLPFAEIGRAVLFGLDANAHAPFHRDSEPGESLGIAQCINLHPDPHKRLWLASEDGSERVEVRAHAFWFNDMDYHGVLAAPRFRYSIRVDGRFRPEFLRALERTSRARVSEA